MTKISQYPTLSNPTEEDILIGTDKNNSDETKNFSIGSIINLIGEITQGPIGPQGETGPTGPQGPVGPAGLTWRGEWSSGTAYVVDDAVGYNGASWFCVQNVGPSANTPDVDISNWALLASQGAVGPTGPAGPQGPQGPMGSLPAFNFKYYEALLTQVGTSNPTVYVLENTLDGDITWVRTSEGLYTGTLSAGTFTNLKTSCLISPSIVAQRQIDPVDNTTVQIKTFDTGFVDGYLNETPVIIKVYN